MNRITTILLPLLLIAQLAGAQSKPATAAKAQVFAPQTKRDSMQYALGIYIGTHLLKGGFGSLDLKPFMAGVSDAYSDAPRPFSDSIALKLVSDEQDRSLDKRNRLFEAQLFETLKTKTEAGRLPSGVQFIVLTAGKGPRPQETDSILIHYKGLLASGELFENTFTSNTPIATTPKNLIPGLSEMLQLMPEGSTYEVFIPSALGYGAKGNNRIPPNSALIVTVELIKVKRQQ